MLPIMGDLCPGVDSVPFYMEVGGVSDSGEHDSSIKKIDELDFSQARCLQ